MIVGIDLGTTYSAMAFVELDGLRKIIKNIDGNETTPSVVHWRKNGEEIIVGKRAKNLSVGFPDETIMEIKREIGSSKIVKIYGKEYTPEGISGLILAKLKKDAEEQLREKITNVVVSVPAYFRDGERKATIAAAKIAGWKDDEITIINEPNAAAMEFGLDEKIEKGKILVFDLGGGTFDVTVLNIGDKIFIVETNGGERNLGGKDFDKRLMDYIIDEVKKEHKVDLNEEKYKTTKQELVLKAEETKNALSSNMSYDIVIDFIITDKKVNFSKEITRDKFNELTKDLVEKTKNITIKTLNDAKIDKQDLDKIVMVGGCSRIPAVRDAVKEIFPGKEILLHDPDLAIAKGAAIYGSIFFSAKTPEEKAKQKIMREALGSSGGIVSTHALGIEAIVNGEDGIFSTIIKKDQLLPTKGTEIYYPSLDQQTEILIKVYEGEERIAAHPKNSKWGEMKVTEIPPKPKGVEKIEVTFEYSLVNTLRVSSKILSTGKVFTEEFRASKESVAMDNRIKEDIKYLK